MWYDAMSTKELDLIDIHSSSLYVYIRKFKEKKLDSAYNIEVYYYSECKVTKEAYEMLTSLNAVEDRLDDVESILASMIGGTVNG